MQAKATTDNLPQPLLAISCLGNSSCEASTSSQAMVSAPPPCPSVTPGASKAHTVCTTSAVTHSCWPAASTSHTLGQHCLAHNHTRGVARTLADSNSPYGPHTAHVGLRESAAHTQNTRSTAYGWHCQQPPYNHLTISCRTLPPTNLRQAGSAAWLARP
jgi:hypothetical protein